MTTKKNIFYPASYLVMAELDKEMQRLESNLTGLGGSLGGLQGNAGQLAQDFAAVEQFLHDLGCIFGGPQCTSN
jgi:hypothetical protein